MMRKQRLLTLAMVICLIVCLFTACNTSASVNGDNTGGNQDCTHSSTEWKIDKEATCTTAGSKHEECSSCGETLGTESILSLGHDYNETIIPPTEEQQGYTLHQCSRCEDNYKDNFVDYEYTEAQYKQMFEKDILDKIQGSYNENIAPVEDVFLHELELELVNYETGDVYFTCTQNNTRVMLIANSEEVAQWATYEALYENLPGTFSFTKAVSVQEDDLAQDIVEFALSQPAVQAFAQENNLDLENLKILNVEKASASEDGRHMGFNIKLIGGDKIVSLRIDGSTGICSSDEGYLEKLQNATKVAVSNLSIKPYSDL